MSILELTISAPVFKELETIDEKKRPLAKFGELRLWGQLLPQTPQCHIQEN